MASSQDMATGKAKFFARLDRLGQSDDDDNDEKPTTHGVRMSRATSKSENTQKHCSADKSTGLTNKNQKPSEAPRVDVDLTHSQPSSHPSQEVQIIEVPAKTSEIQPNSTSKTRSAKTQPISSAGVAPTAAARSEKQSIKSSRASTMRGQKTRPENAPQSISEEQRIFNGLTFFFIPNSDVAPARRKRIQAAIAHGATWARRYDQDVTHVIVDVDINFTAAAKAFPSRRVPSDALLLKDTWLSESVDYKSVQDVQKTRFRVKGAPVVRHEPPKLEQRQQAPVEKQVSADARGTKRKLEQIQHQPPSLRATVSIDDLDKAVEEVRNNEHLASDDDLQSFNSLRSAVPETESEAEDEHGHESEPEPKVRSPPRPNKGFQCMEVNDGSNDHNPNARTIEMLQKMATFYDRTGDKWRTLSYRKAIGALRQQKVFVTTKEQALAIPQIGDRLADKIEEIVTTDRLRRYESAVEDPNDQILQLFMGIYDVGLKQATIWIGEGHRTLDDLSQHARLTPNQKVGIAHYDDFMQRIPREEVARHGGIVLKALRQADPYFETIIGGSYRRGQEDSGDIDIIVTKIDAGLENIRQLVMDTVIPRLKKDGFLKVTLASSTTRDRGSKWHGASCLPGSTVWRRIDLLFVPYNELGAALIYFTGNDIFNRSMRLLAGTKGMRLNQHGLYKDVMRGKDRKKETEGTLLESASEMEIFKILGVPWRPPKHRIC